jgi:hypothetical protein
MRSYESMEADMVFALATCIFTAALASGSKQLEDGNVTSKYK